MSGEADSTSISSTETSKLVENNETKESKEQPIQPDKKPTADVTEEINEKKPVSTEKVSKVNDKQSNCILFYGVTYLGCAAVNMPKSEQEINKIMSTLNEQCKLSIEVTMSVPQHIEEKIVLMDTINDDAVITEYKMTHVLFVVRGQKNTTESSCFAFTTCHGDSPDNYRFSCHVFRCNLADAVSKILYSFWTVFNRHQNKQETTTSQVAAPKRTNSESSTTGQFTSVATSFFGALNITASSFGSITGSNSNNNPNNTPYSQEHSDFALQYSNGKLEDQYIFRAILDIKEEDPKNPGNFTSVPKDKETFKLRKNVDKQIIINIQQLTNQTLEIERCFGVLMCPGRNVSHKDMQLLQTISMGKTANDSPNVSNNYMVSANWDILDSSMVSSLQVLNDETQKEMRVFMTIAVDLVIDGLQDPVRFCIETKARIYAQNEKFWVFNKLKHFEEFYLQIKKNNAFNSVTSSSPASPINSSNLYRLDSIHSLTELTRKKNVESSVAATETSNNSVETPISDDENEPIVSGCGNVTKECGEDELLDWSDLLLRWRKTTWNERPKGLQSLVRKGIPEALRGEVWQLLAGCNENEKSMNESYRLLLSKESPSENIIVRDINRTFTGHQFFQDESGQQALYKLSKAYSIYDEEVGYCQGLSFLIASLLLHVPEEQAFNLLVKIMYRYEVREIYKTNFEALHLRFFQLENLIKEYLPQLYEHFIDLNIEAHMYASQWFLTLFTAKFPLNMVFRILDLFLSEGVLVIFSVALSLLKNSQRDLLALDFEGILKYFRVTMPKKYRQEQNFKDLMTIWMNLNSKITDRRLKKYEKNYKAWKEAEALKEDPSIRFEKECKRLNITVRRLEQENDDLANEYIESKINLSKQIEDYKDNYEITKSELIKYKTDYQNKLNESYDTNKKLMNELDQLKKIWRKQTDKYEGELERNTIIITEYKQICNTLSNKVEKWAQFRKKYEAKVKKLDLCDTCSETNKLDAEILDPSENTTPTENNSSNDLNGLTKSYSSDSSASSHSTSNDPYDSVDKYDDPLKGTDTDRIKHLELELARVKLELVDAQCKNQEFDHRLKGYENSCGRLTKSTIDESYETPMSSTAGSLNKNSSSSNNSIYSSLNSLQSANGSNSWLSKTFTQFKEAKNQVVQKAQKVKIPSPSEFG